MGSKEKFWQTLDRPIIALAPMEGVTDAVLRQLLLALADPGRNSNAPFAEDQKGPMLGPEHSERGLAIARQ